MDHIRNLLMIKMGLTPETLPSLAGQDMERLQRQSEPVSDVFLNQILSFLLAREEDLKFSNRPKIAMELTLIKIVQTPPALPMDQLIEKIESLKDRFLDLAAGDADLTRDNDTMAAPGPASPQTSPLQTSPAQGAPAQGVPAQANSSRMASAEPPPTGNRPAPTAAGSELDQASPPKTSDSEDNPDQAGVNGRPETEPSSASAGDSADAWEQILRRIDNEYPLLAANLTNSTLSRLEDGKIEIEVYGSRVNLNILRQKNQYETLQGICRDFFDKNIELVITHKLDPDNTRESAPPEPKPQRHPLVAEALEIFGGDIVNTS